MSYLPPGQNSSGTSRRSFIFIAVVLCHIALITGPLCFFSLLNKVKPPEENMLRVKIGGRELSSGPEVGRPERIRPQRAVEPDVPQVKPEPRIPQVKPEPVVKAKPKPKIKPRKVVKAKPKPKVTPKPKVKPRKKVVKPAVKKVKPARKIVKKTPPKPRRVQKKTVKPRRPRNLQDEVYQDPNFNPNVPIGSRNRAQRYAPRADNRSPGGGSRMSDADFARYGRNVERYIYSRWAQPPRSLLGGQLPETLIELTVDASGKVLAAKIIKGSTSRAMEESVKALLGRLDILPRPPSGRLTFQILLKTR